MDIFEFAMQMERDGESYYLQLAEKCGIGGLKDILNRLAADELGHYQALQKLRDGVAADLNGTDILINAKNIFQELKDRGEHLDCGTSEIDLYKKAIDIEKRSEEFYREKASQVEMPELKETLLKIAEDEKKHQFLLHNTVEFLSRPHTWLENAEFVHLDEY